MSSARPSEPGFTTGAMARIFGADARVAAFCRVEAALARAHADVGSHGEADADRVEVACAEPIDDATSVLADGWEEGSPIIPLLSILRGRLEGATDALHRGATTQDIVDTATMLQVRDGLGELERGVDGLATRLAALVSEHRDTPMAARTFLQQAGVTTFGAVAAGWLTSLASTGRAMDRWRGRLPVQLAGPIGTGSGLGDAAALRRALAARLELSEPPAAWHADRSIVREVVEAVTATCLAAAKVAVDLVLLAQTEVSEVRMRPGGSTSVPDKRNPIDAVHAIAASEAATATATAVLAPRVTELQRGIGGWHVEWFAIPVVFEASGAALEALEGAIGSLEVDAARMRENLLREPSDDELDAARRTAAAALEAWSVR